MSQGEFVKHQELSAIEESKGYLSFDNLQDVSGLSFIGLSAIIGLLLKERRIELWAITYRGRDNTYGSRAEELFGKFTYLLFDNFIRERSVSFYASELCVTLKYLSAVIKQTSDKTLVVWIKVLAFKEMEQKLRHSQACIKEIAYDMNFPNVSFFGKSFKKHSGISPSHYRQTFVGTRLKNRFE